MSILRINPPKFGGGLKFESDAGIGQKRAFFKGLGGNTHDYKYSIFKRSGDHSQEN